MALLDSPVAIVQNLHIRRISRSRSVHSLRHPLKKSIATKQNYGIFALLCHLHNFSSDKCQKDAQRHKTIIKMKFTSTTLLLLSATALLVNGQSPTDAPTVTAEPTETPTQTSPDLLGNPPRIAYYLTRTDVEDVVSLCSSLCSCE